MDPNVAVPGHIASVSFSFLSPEEIRAISVKRITNPVLFEGTGQPTLGGLYDPALGPIEKNDLCATCQQNYFDCPGHFGHIELPLPTFHPLFLGEIYNLIRTVCIYCHRLRLDEAVVKRYCGKLRLLEAGLLQEAEELDEFVAGESQRDAEMKETKPKSGKNDRATSVAGLTSAIDRYVQSMFAKAQTRQAVSGPGEASHPRSNYKSSMVVEARQKLMAHFFKTCMAVRSCSHCAAYANRYRKEGAIRLWQIPLTAKQENSHFILGHKGRSIDALDAEYRALTGGQKAGETLPNGKGNGKGNGDGDVNGHHHESGSEESDVDAIVSPQIQTVEEIDKQTAKKAQNQKREIVLLPGETRAHLRLLFHKEAEIFSLLYKSHGTLQSEKRMAPTADSFFVQVLQVSPSRFRPAGQIGDIKFENPQNDLLNKVISTASLVRTTSRDLGKSRDLKVADKARAYARLLDAIIGLQADINGLMDSTKSSMVVRGGKLPPPGIRQALEKKEGLFRKHMMGKRVNYAARSVISPDPNIETNEIGVPPIFAMTLTYPEPVTHHNIAQLRQAVINGPKIWPGAVAIKDGEGRIQNLANLTEAQRVALANQLLTPSGRHLNNGRSSGLSHHLQTPASNKKVYRHLINGDCLIMNRQPTLHRPSMMVHKARVLPGEKTIRMHYANCNGYNADFDGDEMNMHFPQNEVARAEAATIASTDYQYLVPTSGAPLRGLIQDHVVAGVWITKKDTFFTRSEYQQLLYGALRPEDQTLNSERLQFLPPTLLKPRRLWSGKQVISTILHNLTPVGYQGLNLTSRAKVDGKSWGFATEESSVQFHDGELLTGCLDKAQIGATSYGLVHSIHEIYGPVVAGQLLSILGRLFSLYTQQRGFTCGIDDLNLTPEGDATRRQTLDAGAEYGLRATAGYVGLSIKPLDKDELVSRLEEVSRDNEKMAGLDSAMKGQMNSLTSDVIKKCIPSGLAKKFPFNNMQTMTVSGAKGSNVNVSQISCLLGQQELEGRRVPTMISGKTLPSFLAFDTSAKSGGYVAGRFLTGIKPQEYYFHCMAGREGLIDTAVKTSRSGYLQRCLIKHLEGVRTHYDQTVRDSDGSIVQFRYGEDSLDVMKQKHLYQFQFAVKNVASLVQHYRLDQVAEATNANAKQIRRQSKLALKDPARHDPVLSLHDPSRSLGAVSEKYRIACLKFAENEGAQYIGDELQDVEGDDMHRTLPILDSRAFEELMNSRYLRALLDPGEAVGLIASQSVGEPSTQMTLNTFHFAGFGAKNVTLGIPRLREIVMTASANIKTPTMMLPIADETSEADAAAFCKTATKIRLADIIDEVVVNERLATADEGERSERLRRYTARLQFFPYDEYSQHYGITSVDVLLAMARTFTLLLDRLIVRDQRKDNQRKKAAGSSLGQASRVADDYATMAQQSEGEGRAAAAAQDSDDDDLGTALVEGDGDATDVRMAKRSGGLATYDDVDGEADEEPEINEMNPDEADGGAAQEDGSDEEGEDTASVEAEKKPTRKGPSKSEIMNHEQVVIDSSKYMTRFLFDRANGEFAEFDLEFPSHTPKLLLLGIIERAAKDCIIKHISGLERCVPVINEAENDKSRSLSTEGVSFYGIWDKGYKVIDLNKIYSNDIAAILRIYGVEAARQAICKEILGVFGVYHIDVAPSHISLIADYMTHEGGYRPFNRMGIESCPSILQQASFETSTHFVTNATLHGDYDLSEQANLTSPSASIVLGQVAGVGTGSFSIVSPIA